MTESISVPIWLVVVAAVLAFWSILDRLLIPSSRWFLRRRINRIVTELNTRLQFQIPAFKLTKRQVLLDRLTFDPKIMAAVDHESEESGAPREALVRRVERYAREIVPSFNAYFYFRIGNYLARRIAQSLYRVRLGYSDDEGLSKISPNASIVFVMNHRSNMDYLIVAYMAASRAALSYAVGEWARIWPLQTLVRSLGAYFVRRNSKNPLYRRVLARYVQMATESGVVQAMYPEGGLSRDGRLQPLKLGLVSYMVSAFDPASDRDLVFIPVGINYDRVLEDRSLIRTIDSDAGQPSNRPHPRHCSEVGWSQLQADAQAALVSIRLRLRELRDTRFDAIVLQSPGNRTSRLGLGSACRRHSAAGRGPARRNRKHDPGGACVADCYGVRPRANPAHERTRSEGTRATADWRIGDQEGLHPHSSFGSWTMRLPWGLRMLVLRHFVIEEEGLYHASAGEREMLRYYANAIGHFLSPLP